MCFHPGEPSVDSQLTKSDGFKATPSFGTSGATMEMPCGKLAVHRSIEMLMETGNGAVWPWNVLNGSNFIE